MTREAAVLREVHLRLGARPDVRLWRQNTGVAYPLSQVRELVDAVLAGDQRAAVAVAREMRPIRYGLPGMADLIGVVQRGGRLLSVEVKSPSGRLSEEQRAWDAMVRRFGGVSLAPVRGADEAEQALERAL